METIIKAVVVLFLFISMGEAVEDLENIVNGMRLEMNERLDLNEKELMMAKKELTRTQVELWELKARDQELEREVFILKNQPFLHVCGSNYLGQYIQNQVIPFTNILSSSTNTQGGGLDMETGIFIAPVAGSYMVTWSLMAIDNDGDKVVALWLRKNEENIDDSFHVSYHVGTSEGLQDDMGEPLGLSVLRK